MTGGRKKTTKVSAGKRTIRDAELGLDCRGWGEQKGSQLGKLAADARSDEAEADGTKCESSASRELKKGRGTCAHIGYIQSL